MKPKLSKEDRLAKEIQKDIHERPFSLKDAILSLFMWQETPADRNNKK